MTSYGPLTSWVIVTIRSSICDILSVITRDQASTSLSFWDI